MTTQEIADLLSGELIGDGSVEIYNLASLETASEHDLAFAEDPRSDLQTNASCTLVPWDFSGSNSVPCIKVRNPKLAFAEIAKRLLPSDDGQTGIHPTSVVDPSARIRAAWIGAFVSVGENSTVGDGCRIHDGVRIGSNVHIGRGTVIHPNCVVYDNVKIGDECVLHAAVVVGAAGFGYVRDQQGEYHQFPQIGTVVIGDRVEIGANTCVDRGALGETVIGDGTKIDNLVQVGHNVRIGKRVVIAAQTGISGSTVIEDDCVIGGQVGMGDHARVLSGAVIGSQAGILPGKIVRPGVWWGTPVQPLENFKRQNALVKGIGRMKDELRQLKDEVAGLRDSSRAD